ncbi:MAG: DUF2851 family protein [Bacteroidales bacterium]|nr:DUF2851 family protein [Bacteroidales bacterium]
MKEQFLQFIWQQQLFIKDDLSTTEGEKIEIISVGYKNSDAGPDFYDAKIRVGEQIWAGTVEIHVKASDWIKHNHGIDRAYDNVILHVVTEADFDVENSLGVKIPTVQLKYSSKLYEKYMHLILNKGPIPCSDFLPNIDVFYIKTWQNRILIERLERKTDNILRFYYANNKSWEETFYQFLLINFGFKVNSLPFELLSKSLPYKIISKQKDNLLQIEALMYGQSGFLNEDIDSEYFNLLKREYEYLQKKYLLKPIEKHLWKFLRLRPVNFPTIRIAQLSQILHSNVNMFSKIISCDEVEQIKQIFRVNVSEYWLNHYTFGKKSPKKDKHLGELSINGLLINTVAVFLFAYGIENKLEKYKEKALDLLETIPPENNSIIEKWDTSFSKPISAFETQSMIELYNEYCKKGRCLDCSIGGKIIIKENY